MVDGNVLIQLSETMRAMLDRIRRERKMRGDEITEMEVKLLV
jgi:hypothetical protein